LIASPRTLQHRKSKGVNHLTHDEADRVVRIARILALAEQIFGSLEVGLGWLRRPDERLNNRSALSMLQTESGGRLVESMLWQVADGIYS
jgi:putative toxin-antitoxin system antitoxin component (TIGR02293 family)